MARIGSLALVFMLLASLGFPWTADYSPPSCLSQYTVSGVNFTYGLINSSIGCQTSTTMANLTGQTANGDLQIFGSGSTSSSSGMALSSAIGVKTGNLTIDLSNITSSVFVINSTCSATRVSGGYAYYNCSITNGTSNITTIGNVTVGSSVNYTAWTFTNLGSYWNITSNTSSAFITSSTTITINATVISTDSSNSAAATFSINNVSISGATYTNISTGIYRGQFSPYLIWSDFKTGNSIASPSSYCQLLLYFNNPYYGNIQLIPKISYIPGIDAFPNFYNATSTSAYIPNNTITYIYDSITSSWYIVPATICNSYSIVGSTSTLQYNPTSLTPGQTGTVPINVNQISGSCSYASTTRIITCTGSDASGTLTNLNLSAYQTGNNSLACSNAAAGASGTLTCTLPNVNGTYSAYFYGKDANQLYYLIATGYYQVGQGSQTAFGRDGFLAAMIIVVVSSMVLTSSIAVSMILACFGLFISVAFGIVPIETGTVAALFAVVALALAYRLKV